MGGPVEPQSEMLSLSATVYEVLQTLICSSSQVLVSFLPLCSLLNTSTIVTTCRYACRSQNPIPVHRLQPRERRQCLQGPYLDQRARADVSVSFLSVKQTKVDCPPQGISPRFRKQRAKERSLRVLHAKWKNPCPRRSLEQ